MIERPEPEIAADERTTLVQFLDYFRATLEWKAEGLSDEQAATATAAPSDLTISGLVRHLTDVERTWFRHCFEGEAVQPVYWTDEHPDGDLEVDAATSLDEALATWRAEIERSREIVESVTDLGETSAAPNHGDFPSMRWILVHMIEEYARHCGHADLIREGIDGARGD
jgi:uncharacterized damage-inducible protein DinB